MGSERTGGLESEGLDVCFPSEGEVGEGVKTLPSLPHLIGFAPARVNERLQVGSPRLRFLTAELVIASNAAQTKESMNSVMGEHALDEYLDFFQSYVQGYWKQSGGQSD